MIGKVSAEIIVDVAITKGIGKLKQLKHVNKIAGKIKDAIKKSPLASLTNVSPPENELYNHSTAWSDCCSKPPARSSLIGEKLTLFPYRESKKPPIIAGRGGPG